MEAERAGLVCTPDSGASGSILCASNQFPACFRTINDGRNKKTIAPCVFAADSGCLGLLVFPHRTNQLSIALELQAAGMRKDRRRLTLVWKHPELEKAAKYKCISSNRGMLN
ncbi:uncharacterized protein LOC132248563 isoform X2 [Alligator mississippiensis]|uniref:uncharacterized protein LOC132248563 isoform X2 n=1 Tax=Alligator mississippiensis TaxID=8496 RepID=UPI0028775359|nr:uncharacterized protein LOC132248563 isoform X2 [Alligator mississippiensis]